MLQPTANTHGCFATVDFGANTDDGTASVTVTGQSWVRSTSVIVATPYGSTADHEEGDAAIEGVSACIANIVPGVGFDVFAFSANGSSGTYKFSCLGINP